MLRRRKLSALSLAFVSSLIIAAPAAAYTYPPSIQKGFIKACSSTGGTPKLCTCVIKYIEKRESLKQFEKDATHTTKGHVPAIEENAIKACV